MKKIIILFCLLMLAGSVNSATISGGGTESAEPLTISEDYTFLPEEIYPGDIVTLSLFVPNNSINTSAENARIRLLLDDSFEAIEDEDDLGVILAGNVKTAVLRFKVKEDALPGTHKISANLYYTRGSEDLHKVFNLTVPISEKEVLDVYDVKVEEIIHVDETFKIKASVTNLGSNVQRNVWLSIAPKTGSFEKIKPLNETELYLGDLKNGDIIEAEFLMVATEKGNYPFKITAASKATNTTAGEELTLEVKGKPSLIFSGIDLSIEGKNVKKITQGDLISYSIQLDNIGEETAKAVEISLSFDEKAIKGVKKVFVGNIDADDSGSAIFDLSIEALAQEKEYPIDITISYLDELGNRQTISNKASIFVFNRPPESPVTYFAMAMIILVLLYLTLRLVFSHFHVRKH